MRKWILAALLALLLIPAAASALPDTPYDAALMTCYPQLTETQQTVFDLAYRSARMGETLVTLPEGTSYDDASRAVKALMWDCPELSALGARYTITYYANEPDTALEILLTFDHSLEDQTLLLQRAVTIVSGAPEGDWNKVLYYHDLVCAVTEYDLGARQPSSAVGVLLDGRATCEGYARAMALLCRLSGIPAGIIKGDAWDGDYMQPHSWNAVCIDGEWSYLDATWNDQESAPEPLRWYFGMTDERIRMTHRASGDFMIPVAMSDSADWYVRRGRYVTSANEDGVLDSAMRELVQTGAVQLRFADDAGYAAFLDGMGSHVGAHMSRDDDRKIVYLCSDALRCIAIFLE